MQELLAPAYMVYCNKEWQVIGIKRVYTTEEKAVHQRTMELVAEATDIPISSIDGTRDLRHACFAKKLSWAAKRTTTRDEDVAYCLLGLLDVNMPLLYGEGGATAVRTALGAKKLHLLKTGYPYSLSVCSKSLFGSRMTSLSSRSRLRTALESPPQLKVFQRSGIFASRPRWFFKSADVKAIGSKQKTYQTREPYAITNKGLQFTAQAWEVGPNLPSFL